MQIINRKFWKAFSRMVIEPLKIRNFKKSKFQKIKISKKIEISKNRNFKKKSKYQKKIEISKNRNFKKIEIQKNHAMEKTILEQN